MCFLLISKLIKVLFHYQHTISALQGYCSTSLLISSSVLFTGLKKNKIKTDGLLGSCLALGVDLYHRVYINVPVFIILLFL